MSYEIIEQNLDSKIDIVSDNSTKMLIFTKKDGLAFAMPSKEDRIIEIKKNINNIDNLVNKDFYKYLDGNNREHIFTDIKNINIQYKDNVITITYEGKEMILNFKTNQVTYNNKNFSAKLLTLLNVFVFLAYYDNSDITNINEYLDKWQQVNQERMDEINGNIKSLGNAYKAIYHYESLYREIGARLIDYRRNIKEYDDMEETIKKNKEE